MELLKTLMHLPILGQMRLVGGTALALQYGHRRSIDLDFFGVVVTSGTTQNRLHLGMACNQLTVKGQK